MKSTEDGAQRWDPLTTYQKFEARIRRKVAARMRARGVLVPVDQVHEHPDTQDAFQRAVEVVMRALRDWLPDKGMDLEMWILFRLRNTEPDKTWFDGPLSYPRGVISDYLAAVASSINVLEQRAEWEARGRDPVDFDLIDVNQAFHQPRLADNWSGDEEDWDDQDVTAIPDDTHSVEDQALGRVFLTKDLTEVEQRVLYYRRLGYTNDYIGRVLLPDHLFDRSEDDSVARIETKVSRIYSRAKAKAQSFNNIDESAL